MINLIVVIRMAQCFPGRELLVPEGIVIIAKDAWQRTIVAEIIIIKGYGRCLGTAKLA